MATLWSSQEGSELQREGKKVVQLCSCCDRPASHHFAVSYRGQVLTGAICEEHGDAVARARLGLQDRLRDLAPTKIGRALTDRHSKPRFQRIREPEHQEIAGGIRRSGLEFSSNGFSSRRRRSTSRSRRTRTIEFESEFPSTQSGGVEASAPATP
jgi:hypothetical protein